MSSEFEQIIARDDVIVVRNDQNEIERLVFWDSCPPSFIVAALQTAELLRSLNSVWIDNAKGMARTGHGGVPLMVWKDEPFFGGDRFDQFVYRLQENGLTRRPAPRAPFTTEPLRWPKGL